MSWNKHRCNQWATGLLALNVGIYPGANRDGKLSVMWGIKAPTGEKHRSIKCSKEIHSEIRHSNSKKAALSQLANLLQIVIQSLIKYGVKLNLLPQFYSSKRLGFLPTWSLLCLSASWGNHLLLSVSRAKSSSQAPLRSAWTSPPALFCPDSYLPRIHVEKFIWPCRISNHLFYCLVKTLCTKNEWNVPFKVLNCFTQKMNLVFNSTFYIGVQALYPL